MIAALIGDVHANLPALEAVLAHAAQQGAQAVWNIGDFVGYGAYPEETVQRLRQVEAISVIGNYDQRVLKVPHKLTKWSQTKAPDKVLAFLWAYEHLSLESKTYLSMLPVQRLMDVDGWRVLLTHGSPASTEEHLMPDTPAARLRELAKLTPADIIICGHSHRAFAQKIDQVTWINTGTVGRPDDGDPRAGYAILELNPGKITVQHHRVAYDVERAVSALQAAGLPDRFAQMLRSGRSYAALAEAAHD